MSQTLGHLLDATAVRELRADPLTPIASLSCDSRQAAAGCLFFALRGEKADGADFAAQAAAGGAAAIVSEKPLPDPAAPWVGVPDARAAMAEIAARFHDHPSRRLKLAGVTGTNGKTTTTFLIKHLLDADHRRCGLIGTVKYCVGDTEMDAPRTTPESLEVQQLLDAMVQAGSKAAAMEVSSHALVQHRVRSIDFDAAAFTNLTQDHLDYHKTMDAYFEAKAAFFEQAARQTAKKCRAIVNADDRYGHLLIERFKKKLSTVTYGLSARADFRATDVRFDATGGTFHLAARRRSYLVRSPLIGGFNIYNSLAALACAAAMGMELRAAVAAMADAPQTPGRLERVLARRSFQVFVDYAHTDDALRNVLRTLRELRPSRIICVFGCGGDRDRAKRPLMGAASEELADWTILTSDNPRSEDPLKILAEIRSGLRASRHEEIPDRAEAIRKAVGMAGARDIVLIAGKGHETYQEFAGRKVPFDDLAIARRAIEDRRVETEEDASARPPRPPRPEEND